ncbi:unnamed protein product [Oreochromis niloticus]|nr:unnamed protein product [Mustela putorius furo]
MVEQQVSREIIDGGSVHIWLDETNQQIAFMLQKKLQEAFKAFVDHNLGDRAYQVDLPVKFEKPIYGSQNKVSAAFVTPGAALSIMFYQAIGLTTLAVVLERKEGLLDRCFVSGMRSFETILAHLFAQLFIISIQIILLLLMILLVFKIPNEGSLVLIIILLVLQGVTGISFGLVISSVVDDEQNALQAVAGLFQPNLLLSGKQYD